MSKKTGAIFILFFIITIIVVYYFVSANGNEPGEVELKTGVDVLEGI